MIQIFHLNQDGERAAIEALLNNLRLNPADFLPNGARAKQAAIVNEILADVAQRGDEALVEQSKKFDDPNFTADQIKVTPQEMKQAAARIAPDLMQALRRSITQVREYQMHILPNDPPPLHREGIELGLRFTPLASAGLYFPGGKASYPSTLIMLAVPAQVAGVKTMVVCTPPSKYGRNDLVLAAAHELNLTHVYRAGGAAAIAAMAFGTQTIPAVEKIVGPGNVYSQLAKRALAGTVGIDGFLGPSEILVLADETAHPDLIAADMLAQAEHDPGCCFLLTDSQKLATLVESELRMQIPHRQRRSAIEAALNQFSAIIVCGSMDEAIDLANRFAAEHVNIQTRDYQSILKKLTNAGAVFLGPWSPVAAGDYIAGPSHCLPTNTTARFSSGISVYEFLKRSSVVRYEPHGLQSDADSICALADAEQLDAHAASIRARTASRS